MGTLRDFLAGKEETGLITPLLKQREFVIASPELTRQNPRAFVCYPVQILYIDTYYLLTEVQGSFTFPLQQMLHASIVIRITSLKTKAKSHNHTEHISSNSRNCWYVSDAGGRIVIDNTQLIALIRLRYRT